MARESRNKPRLLLVAALVGAALILGAASAVGQGQGSARVTICHVPPGNPDNAHTITISENALEAHLAHGDSEGACDGDGEDFENGQKIAICHIPPGNPDNAHTIVISVNALDAHLAHGDTVGECPGNGDEPPPLVCVGPQDISAHNDGPTNVVEWSAFAGADSYNLYRAEAGGDFSLLASVDGDNTTLRDSDVTVGTTYEYFVTAVVEGNETEACDIVEITAIPVFTTALAGVLASIVGIGAYVMSRRRA